MYNEVFQKVSLYIFSGRATGTDILLRSCAENFLSRYGQKVEVTSVVRDEKGAPRIAGDGMSYVSVSHSGDYTVCAVSDQKIGVDLQETRRLLGETEEEQASRLMRLAKRFFHPGDTAWIERDPIGRFFTVWSAKESYVKYTGDGIDDAFALTKVIPEGGPFGSEWECDGMYYSSLPFAENYSFCICCGHPAETETIFADLL